MRCFLLLLFVPGAPTISSGGHTVFIGGNTGRLRDIFTKLTLMPPSIATQLVHRFNGDAFKTSTLQQEE
jgi:hypothetical protein